MEIFTFVGAIVTGLVTVVVGIFSLAAIWFDDLVERSRVGHARRAIL